MGALGSGRLECCFMLTQSFVTSRFHTSLDAAAEAGDLVQSRCAPGFDLGLATLLAKSGLLCCSGGSCRGIVGCFCHVRVIVVEGWLWMQVWKALREFTGRQGGAVW